MLLGTGALAQQMVGDFAPLKVGNVWGYSYNYFYHPFDFPMSSDTAITETLSVIIEVQSSHTNNTDTIFLLSVTEVGKRYRCWISYAPTIVNFDTIPISDSLVDSAIVRNGVVIPAPGYCCHVFPFCKKHAIEQDSLKKGILGADTLFYLSKKYSVLAPPYSVTSIYVQNIGLYDSSSYFYDISSDDSYGFAISLLSFNNQPIPPLVGVRPASVSSPRAIVFNPTCHLRISCTGKPDRLFNKGFMLNGRSMSTYKNSGAMPVIETGQPQKK